MSLATLFASTPLREISGGRTQARFDYQTHWGIGLILRCHEGSDDYSVAFEFHDDVVWLNHSSAPDRVKFHQIKTKQTGSWSISELTNPSSTKDKSAPSIIALMIQNCRAFAGYVDGAVFVSNASCTGIPYEQQNFQFCDCDEEIMQVLQTKLAANSVQASDEEIGLLSYNRTDLSLGDAENHSKGLFNKFLTTHYGNQAIGVDALYQAIFDECRRRANHTSSLSTFADVTKHKAVTRQQFDEWLSTVTTAHLAPKWEAVQSDLDWSAIEKRAVRREWNAYHSMALDPGNEAVRAARRVIRGVLDETSSDGSLAEVVQQIATLVRPSVEELLPPFVTEAKLRAMILWEYAAQ